MAVGDFLEGLGHAAGGVASGVGTGFALRGAYDQRKRDTAYRHAVKAGLGSDRSRPNYRGAADVAASHGRHADLAAFTGMADRRQSEEDKIRTRAAIQARELWRRNDLVGLNRLVGQLPPGVFGLEKHRKPIGITMRSNPETGEPMMAIMIRNDKTRSDGPMTANGTADKEDQVITIPAANFDAYLSGFLPGGDPGEWKAGHRGQRFHTRTGQTMGEPMPEYRAPRSPIKMGEGDVGVYDPERGGMVHTQDPSQGDRKRSAEYVGTLFQQFRPELAGVADANEVLRRGEAAVNAMADDLYDREGISRESSVRFFANALLADGPYKAAILEGNLGQSLELQAQLIGEATSYLRPEMAPQGAGGPGTPVGSGMDPGGRAPTGPQPGLSAARPARFGAGRVTTTRDLRRAAMGGERDRAEALPTEPVRRAQSLLARSSLPDEWQSNVALLIKDRRFDEAVQRLMNSPSADDPEVQRAILILRGGEPLPE